MGGSYEAFGTSVISSEGKSILCQNVKMQFGNHIQKRIQGSPQENQVNDRMT
jgi:hypothetical protein